MLAEYQKLEVPEYLDGRYFERAMRNLDRFCVSGTPLIIRLSETTIYTNEESFMADFSILAPVMYSRIIIEQMSHGQTISRHSNLLLVDYEKKKVIHFEPDPVYMREKSDVIVEVELIIKSIFKAWEEGTMIVETHIMTANGVKRHSRDISPPNHNIEGGYCVAYVLKYAYFHKLGYNMDSVMSNTSLQDIRKFARATKRIYGTLPSGEIDIEFGSDNTNKVIGGLAGAGLGYALLGPAGGLLGGAGGVWAGSKVGEKKNNRETKTTIK